MIDITPADAELEYPRFIRTLRNRQRVWSLQTDGGLATWSTGEEGDPGIVPFWSSHEGASACARVSFPGYRPVPLSTEEFPDEWLPAVQERGLFMGVNMADTMAGIDVRADGLRRQLAVDGG